MPWQKRPIDPASREHALAQGVSELQANLIASRVRPGQPAVDLVIDPKPHVLHWRELPDIDPAAERIARAVRNREWVATLGDHDCDGVFAASVVREALVEHFGMPADHVVTAITHRTREGYGLTSRFVERVLEIVPRPTLVITVDQGKGVMKAMDAHI